MGGFCEVDKASSKIRNNRRAFISKFPSTCIECGRRIPKGQLVLWKPGTKGVICKVCSAGSEEIKYYRRLQDERMGEWFVV